MQRSTESRWGTDTGLSYSDSDASISSDTSAQFDVSTPPTEASSTSYTPNGGLHDPPSPECASLLHIAVVLSNSLPSPPDDDIFSAPPPEEDAQFTYPEKDEDMTEEEYHSRLTILGIHQLARRAALPLDTFILAALILKQLQTVSEEFYDDWLYELRKARVREYDRCKEVVVLSAIIIAQKFLHDAIYILTTWTEMVCEGREDLHHYNLSITERLILKHISWRVSMIADPKEIERQYTDAITSTHSQYEHLCSKDADLGYYDDEGDANISPL
jgi:hypothetical protein